MHWSYAELMATPADIVEAAIAYLNAQAARQPSAEGVAEW